ncbi:MAG TPA: YceD family protein [Rhizomicrobium sp.]|jgi:uncharacterized metal-binding protein YceD (DUF177 family)|nr:YceD family protein [Rhizomicrobium sp.]
MTEKSPVPPLERIFDLGDLSEAGTEVRIAPSESDLAKLAQWVEVDAIEKFEAVITLRRSGQARFLYSAHLTAGIVQTCVVTLAPLHNHIDSRFERELLLVRKAHHPEQGGEVVVGATDEEGPEEIESSRFDIAGPVLEEFILAIDPYPKAPDAAFAAPQGAEEPRRESPFAVLGKLKGKS